MTLVADLDNGTPGDWQFATSPGRDKPTHLYFRCPCCGRQSTLPLRPISGDDLGGPSWEWDGNEDAPTLTPSIQFIGGCKWHGWLRAGKWVTA